MSKTVTTGDAVTTASQLDETSPQPPSSTETATLVSKEINPQYVKAVRGFFSSVGIADFTVDKYSSADYFSDIIGGLLRAQSVERGRVSCVLSVLPAVINYFGGFHGGACGAIAERVSIACARTVVAEDKDIFLGELAISYLSSAVKNDVLVVDGWVVRSGRNLTVVAMEFRIKKTGKLVYTARATFYHLPVAKL